VQFARKLDRELDGLWFYKLMRNLANPKIIHLYLYNRIYHLFFIFEILKRKEERSEEKRRKEKRREEKRREEKRREEKRREEKKREKREESRRKREEWKTV